MNMVVKTRIVKIGNSQGVRIPKLLLDQINLGEDIELTVEEDQIIIRSALPTRHGWEKAFQEMSEAGDDSLLDAESVCTSVWDEESWEW